MAASQKTPKGSQSGTSGDRRVYIKSKKKHGQSAYRPGDSPPRGQVDGVLARGESAAIRLVNVAIERFGEDDEVVRLALGTLIGISRGSVDENGIPYLRRHVGDRIKAVNDLLDRTHGKARERMPKDDENKFADVDRVLANLLQDKG